MLPRICIVGARGFLGSFLATWFSQRGYPVTKLSFGPNPGGKSEILFWEDLESLSILLESVDHDVLINCAAITDLLTCDRDFEAASKVNSSLPLALLDLALRSDSFFIHMSSDAVYAKPDLAEESSTLLSLPTPRNSYAESKLAGDIRILERAHPHAAVIRTSFYGHSAYGRQSFMTSCLGLMAEGKLVSGFVDYRVSSLYIGTLAMAIRRIIELKIGGLVLLGTKQSFSKHELAVTLARNFGYSEKLVVAEVSPPGFHSSGGLNCAVDSDDSWQRLGLVAPSLAEDAVQASIENKNLRNGSWEK